jgi:hypothetical protein
MIPGSAVLVVSLTSDTERQTLVTDPRATPTVVRKDVILSRRFGVVGSVITLRFSAGLSFGVICDWLKALIVN